jgi:hypothetical protein
MTKATAEICNQCGRSVKPGSGWLVNRVPSDFGSVEGARVAGAPYPEGAWQCSECAEDVNIFGNFGDCPRPVFVEMLEDALGRVPTPEETDECLAYLKEDIDKLAEEFSTMIDERIATWTAKKQLQGL